MKKNDLKEIEDINFQLERLKEKPVSEDVVEETLDEVFAEPNSNKKNLMLPKYFLVTQHLKPLKLYQITW